MLRFLSQRAFHLSIVNAFAFWTLILLNPQSTDGAPNDEWGTFFDHYGEDLERLESSMGDVLQKTDGSLLLIYNKFYYFQMETHDIQEGQSDVRCHFYKYPQKGDDWPKRKMKKMRKAPRPILTTQLASRFADRFLPFHPEECNKLHYMNYILYEHPKLNQPSFKECPLAAPWSEMSASQIASGEFKLKDSNRVIHDFSEYNSPKRPRSEPQTYVTNTFGKPLGKSQSWLQRAYTLRRKVSKTYQVMPSSKRQRSS